MESYDPARLRVHEDAALFRETVNFTAAETGFAAVSAMARLLADTI